MYFIEKDIWFMLALDEMSVPSLLFFAPVLSIFIPIYIWLTIVYLGLYK